MTCRGSGRDRRTGTLWHWRGGRNLCHCKADRNCLCKVPAVCLLGYYRLDGSLPHCDHRTGNLPTGDSALYHNRDHLPGCRILDLHEAWRVRLSFRNKSNDGSSAMCSDHKETDKKWWKAPSSVPLMGTCAGL